MNKCIIFEGRRFDYQNEAMELYLHFTGLPIGQFCWIVTNCETDFCVTPQHMEIRQPIALDYPKGVCVYCGLSANTRDHLMPVTWTGESQRHSVFTVPACRECNGAISDSFAMSITERRRIAQRYIAKRYKSILRYREFTEEEIDTFEGVLRSSILAGIEEKRIVESRISWPPIGFDDRAVERSGVDAYHCGLIHA